MGTAVGNSGTGIAVGSETLGTTTGAVTTGGNGLVTPGSDVVSGGVYGGGSPAMGGTAVAIAPRAAGRAGSATPLLDQATRNAERRVARQRAAGEPPRIIGIAPRTNADRTDEMPDDPIIRY
jgi:hypothetical protein